MYKFARLFGLFVLISTFFLLPSGNASAAFVRCRTDPIFLLSNGDVINVTVDISTNDTNIRNIHYVLHVPADVTVKKVTYTAPNFSLHEMHEVIQDIPARAYTTDTVVTTETINPVQVLSMTRLNSVFTKYVSGYRGEHLTLAVSPEESFGWIFRQ